MSITQQLRELIDALREPMLSSTSYFGGVSDHRKVMVIKLEAILRDAGAALPVSDEDVARMVEEFAKIISGAPFPSVRSYVKARQIADMAIEALRDRVGTKLYAAPTCDPHSFDRTRETPRRQQAVEKLLTLGWTYHHDNGWTAPTCEQAGEVVAFRVVGRHGPYPWVDGKPNPQPEFIVGEGERLELAYAKAGTMVVPDGMCLVDKGALKLAENVLRRAGKDEVADALIDSAKDAETRCIPDGDSCPHCKSPHEAKEAIAELIDAAKSARVVLGTIYGKYQRQIGPFATQANKADWALHTALARIGGAKGSDDHG